MCATNTAKRTLDGCSGCVCVMIAFFKHELSLKPVIKLKKKKNFLFCFIFIPRRISISSRRRRSGPENFLQNYTFRHELEGEERNF